MRPITLALLLIFACSGCASQAKRQQRSYEKYLRKSSVARAKQRAILRPSKPEMPPRQEPSEAVETTSVGPESVGSSGSE